MMQDNEQPSVYYVAVKTTVGDRHKIGACMGLRYSHEELSVHDDAVWYAYHVADGGAAMRAFKLLQQAMPEITTSDVGLIRDRSTPSGPRC